MASPRRQRISDQILDIVRQRANGLCEYCHTSEKWQYVCFTVDHVIPISQGGTNDNENLALACFHCNRRKSNRTAGVDSHTGLHFTLFNPRQDAWSEHFIWSANGTEIIGLTPTGRATIMQLDLNRPRIVSIRAADVAVGVTRQRAIR